MVWLVLAALLAVACSAAGRRTEGHWVPGKLLAENPRILLLPVTGSEPDLDESARREMTDALFEALNRRGYRVVVSAAGQESGTAALDHAARDGFDYVLTGSIPRWENHVVGDNVAEIVVTLWEVSSHGVVASASHLAKGRIRWPSNPADFIPELADYSLARIFGWAPRVYKGDPPR